MVNQLNFSMRFIGSEIDSQFQGLGQPKEHFS